MSITQRVQAALTRQGVPPTSIGTYGFKIEDGPGDSTLVRWGRGEPFRAVRIIRKDDGLVWCGAALRREGFHATVEAALRMASVYLYVTRPSTVAAPSMAGEYLRIGDGRIGDGALPTSASVSSVDRIAPQPRTDDGVVGRAEHRSD